MTSMREVGYVHKYLLSSMKTCKQEKAHGKKGRFWYKVLVWIPLKVASTFCVFRIFFFLHVNSNITWFYCAVDKKYCLCTIHVLFMYYSCTVHESHDTIHTFKNYFATVFSVFSFRNNKFNPNGPKVMFVQILVEEFLSFKSLLIA